MRVAGRARFPSHVQGVLLIVLAGLLVRLIMAAFAPHPGIADPNHYYNLARSLSEGRGFVVDYVWQYHNPPASVTHPVDYWMPLPAVWPAISLRLLGEGLFRALLPSALLGALLPLLAYAITAAAQLDRPARLIAMASVAFLPEFILNSARTDTTISYVLFAGLTFLFFYHGMRGDPRFLLLAGAAGGLAHLTRLDGILLAPAMAAGAVVFWRFGERPPPWRWLAAMPVVWLLVLAPWLWRNYDAFGVLFPSAHGARRFLFLRELNDHFSYGRELNFAYYLGWGWRNILGNIAFQSLANVKTLYTVLDVGLPITTLMGLGGLALRRDRERGLLLAAPLIFVLGLYVYYSMFTPFGTQGGSFKKSYMVVIPFLSMASAWGIMTFIQPRRVAYIVAGLMALFMLLNGIELTRADFRAARTYNNRIADLRDALNALGDHTGDGNITVMTQDPFILNYHGFYAAMLPSDDRDTIIAAARRYGVDYIILPAARAALDPLYDGVETDPRLPFAGASGDFQVLAVLP